ncbi:MAG: hypothetical protein AAGK71_14080, partial [Pseudomonadota bacterium]
MSTKGKKASPSREDDSRKKQAQPDEVAKDTDPSFAASTSAGIAGLSAFIADSTEALAYEPPEEPSTERPNDHAGQGTSSASKTPGDSGYPAALTETDTTAPFAAPLAAQTSTDALDTSSS